MSRLLNLWFAFDQPVSRRTYLLHGLFLVGLKYAGDVLLVWIGTGQLWDPFDYQRSLTGLMTGELRNAPPVILGALASWAIPFLWIGISMSMRRALDAGRSAWLALLFFVPGLKYLFMAVMCVAPSDVSAEAAVEEPRPYERQLPAALMSIFSGMMVGLTMLALSVFVLQSYGAALFLGTPFVVGAVTAWLFNRGYPASPRETQQVVAMTTACIAGVALATAAEGALCIIMAAPLAIGLGAIGASIGRRVALVGREPVTNALVAMLALPVAAVIDARQPATELREVVSSVEINAPAERVWEYVVAFPPLSAPNEWVFRAGISYPIRAEIRGEGVGAIRYCVFSTGAFVEPITVWEPGRRLAFDVASQPPPMAEWSPYADITPPHLDGYFTSRRGEFRLIPLPDGRTRLEGSTWYEMRLQPALYWSLFGDAFIHRIHGRVLDHIRTNAEAELQKARRP